MKKPLVTGIIMLMPILISAQNQQKTYDYKIFGERIAQAIFEDLSGQIYGNSTLKLSDAGAGRNSVLGYLVRNNELEFLADKLGKTTDELKDYRKQLRKQIAYELTFIKMKYNAGITDWDHVILENVKMVEKDNQNIKTADIILEVKQALKKITFVLQNCMQTNTEWILGDRIYAQGTVENIEGDTRTAEDLLGKLSGDQIDQSIFNNNGRWTAKKAIISYDNYPEKIILNGENIDWTILRKLDFMLLNDGTMSIGAFLAVKDNFSLYSNKWTYRPKSKTIYFSSDEPGVYESRTLTVKSLSDRQMVLEMSDMGATTTYFLNRSTPGRVELTRSEFMESKWYKLFIGKIDLVSGSKSIKKPGTIYKGLAIFKDGKIEEINVKYINKLEVNNRKIPLYIYDKEYLGVEKTDESAVSFIDKDELKAFIIEDELWQPKQIKNKEKWALITVQGPLSSFIVYDLPTATKIQTAGNVADPNPNPEENRELYLELNGELYRNMMVGFRKKVAEMVAENSELASKINNKEKGYGASNQDRIALEFNEWYKEQYPEKFKEYFIF